MLILYHKHLYHHVGKKRLEIVINKRHNSSKFARACFYLQFGVNLVIFIALKCQLLKIKTRSHTKN